MLLWVLLMLRRTSYTYLRMVLHGYLKLCVYFFYKEHTVTVATRVFYYPPGGYFTPPPSFKRFFFQADHPTISTTSDGVKCNNHPIITLQLLLTLTASMLHYKHNQRSWMPNISPQQVAYLHSLVKYKSYSVHHKYHSPAHIKFKSYAQAKAYCIKHSLALHNITTVNHCA